MNKNSLAMLVTTFLLLAACQTELTEPVSTDTAVLPEQTLEPTVEAVDQEDTCVSCHIDKEKLIATARVQEEVEEESSGVG